MNEKSRSPLGPICDTHLHIFGDRQKYPLAGELRSEPPDAPLERFLKEAEAEGVTRMVFDQPSHYGLDNSCMLDAIATVGLDRARAIAAVDADTVTDAELEALDARGVRGIRVNFGYRSTDRAITGQAAEQATKLAPRAAALGWHLEFLVPNWSLKELIPMLEKLPCDFSVGHMGVFAAALGVEQEGFADFLRLHAGRAVLGQVHRCLPHLEAARFFGYRPARSGVRDQQSGAYRLGNGLAVPVAPGRGYLPSTHAVVRVLGARHGEPAEDPRRKSRPIIRF